MLFGGGEIGVSGSNSHGQLGVAMHQSAELNKVEGIEIIRVPKFEDKMLSVIDVACGSNHTMFLTQ